MCLVLRLTIFDFGLNGRARGTPKTLGVDSPFFSIIVLLKHWLLTPGFLMFS